MVRNQDKDFAIVALASSTNYKGLTFLNSDTDRVGFRDIIHNSLADKCLYDHLVIMSYTYIHTYILSQ